MAQRSVESKLEQATRHVLKGREIVAAQSRRVAALREKGADAWAEEDLLRRFESTQAIFEADLAELKRKAGIL